MGVSRPLGVPQHGLGPGRRWLLERGHGPPQWLCAPPIGVFFWFGAHLMFCSWAEGLKTEFALVFKPTKGIRGDQQRCMRSLFSVCCYVEIGAHGPVFQTLVLGFQIINIVTGFDSRWRFGVKAGVFFLHFLGYTIHTSSLTDTHCGTPVSHCYTYACTHLHCS